MSGPSHPPTVIIRHRRENLRKCSLSGLEERGDLRFVTYPLDPWPIALATGYVLLKVGAPPLTPADQGCGLLLIDGTWRLAAVIERMLPFPMPARSLPADWKTAYPRRQTECPDPERGLSSVEALFLAHQILGRSTEGLLARYHWRDQFLAQFASAHR